MRSGQAEMGRERETRSINNKIPEHSIFRYFPAANKMSKKTFHSMLGHGNQPRILAEDPLFLTPLYTCTMEVTHVHTCASCTSLLYKNIQFSPGIMIVS